MQIMAKNPLRKGSMVGNIFCASTTLYSVTLLQEIDLEMGPFTPQLVDSWQQ